MRSVPRLISAVALAVCLPVAAASRADDWQCAAAGVGETPDLVQAASEFLGRAGRIYPSQLLGMVSSGGRVYLVNAKDDGWSERVRLGLMELRLAEPDITASRRFEAAASGGAVEIPAGGDYFCLERGRAGRHGLALDRGGRMFLAPGKSVHLVDPHEWSIVVEVSATGTKPLDFHEILALSGRSGIYAGLSGRRTLVGAGDSVEGARAVVQVAVGPVGRPDGQVVITPRAGEADAGIETMTPVTTSAIAQTASAPTTAAAPVQAVVGEPPTRVVKTDFPAALPSAKATALPAESPPVEAVAASQPVPLAAPAEPPAARLAKAVAERSYVEYAKAVKTLLALRRSGSVRSVSEMTYVHPAVEDWQNLR